MVTGREGMFTASHGKELYYETWFPLEEGATGKGSPPSSRRSCLKPLGCRTGVRRSVPLTPAQGGLCQQAPLA